MRSVLQSLDLLAESHNDRDSLKYHLFDMILSLNDDSTLTSHCHSSFIPVFQCFRDDAYPFGQKDRLMTGDIRRLRVGAGVDKVLPTPAPTPGKALDSGRLPNPVTTPTPQPWW